MFGLNKTTIYLIAAALILTLVVGGAWQYGRLQYKAGVQDTAEKYLKADLKGAEDVRKTTREVLDDIGSDVDADSLLRDTGGFRDD